MNIKTVVAFDHSNIECAFRLIREKNQITSCMKIDFKKLIDLITIGRNVVKKTVYMGMPKGSNGDHCFFSFLKRIGFDIVTKHMKTITLSNGETKNKANFDVEITYDVCAHIWKRECNEVIFFTGDSDFAYLVEKLLALKIDVTIVSSRATLSSELRDSGARVILLDDIDIKQYTFEK